MHAIASGLIGWHRKFLRIGRELKRPGLRDRWSTPSANGASIKQARLERRGAKIQGKDNVLPGHGTSGLRNCDGESRKCEEDSGRGRHRSHRTWMVEITDGAEVRADWTKVPGTTVHRHCRSRAARYSQGSTSDAIAPGISAAARLFEGFRASVASHGSRRANSFLTTS